METNGKKKKREAPTSKLDSDSDEESSNSETDSDSEVNFDEEQINVEFEAQTPVETDFHGIKQLLMNLFVTLHVDLSELTDLLISQDNVGSTIKVVDDEEDELYGIVSILSLKKHQEKNCIKEIQKGLLKKCKSVAADQCQKIETILKEKDVGLVVNERFINIPPQIAVPFHKSLRSETEKAMLEDVYFKFDYLLLVSKTLRPTSLPAAAVSGAGYKTKKKKKKEKPPDEEEYTNFEEEVFHKACDTTFSYSVTEATGVAVGGNWDFGDQAMNTFRTVMLVPCTKWNQILNDIEELLDG